VRDSIKITDNEMTPHEKLYNFKDLTAYQMKDKQHSMVPGIKNTPEVTRLSGALISYN